MWNGIFEKRAYWIANKNELKSTRSQCTLFSFYTRSRRDLHAIIRECGRREVFLPFRLNQLTNPDNCVPPCNCRKWPALLEMLYIKKQTAPYEKSDIEFLSDSYLPVSNLFFQNKTVLPLFLRFSPKVLMPMNDIYYSLYVLLHKVKYTYFFEKIRYPVCFNV